VDGKKRGGKAAAPKRKFVPKKVAAA
jgi:hypothetical protein